MRVLLCLSHSIEEYDQLRLLHSLGYEVASIGGYIDPAHPHDPKRPALEVPCVELVKQAVDELGTQDNLAAAQERIPPAVLEWLGPDGVLIFHHQLHRLFNQWEHLREWREAGGRCVWRTVGQSVESNEREAWPYRADGLEIVRYSPKERNLPSFAGEDALIRFYKVPGEYGPWTGGADHVLNVTQDLVGREPWTNYRFWAEATVALPTLALGPKSEHFGGLGQVSYEEMRAELCAARCYLYTGTQPASYTLGLLEAMMTGCPVVSIGPGWMNIFPYGPALFEGHEIAGDGCWSDDPGEARGMLIDLLDDDSWAAEVSARQMGRAMLEFGEEPVGADWRQFLGAP